MDGVDDHHSDGAIEGNDDGNPNGSEAALACNCCRRRKLRCSREVPACQQCRKTSSECVYETKRAKPGMKAGAIENLHRRLDALERTVQQQGTRTERDRASSQGTPREPAAAAAAAPPSSSDNNPYGILSFFARELQRFNETSGASGGRQPTEEFRQHPQSAKRRRVDAGGGVDGPRAQLNLDVPSLPDDEALEAVLRAYFHNVHPWIPLIHEGRLRRRLLSPPDQQRLRVVLHAMVLCASRYIEDAEIASAWTPSYEQQLKARDWIVAEAMRSLCVESLQALVIIAFNDIGGGEASLAWSIVGSLTRTVEYLQLTVENDETERPSLVQPWISLPPPQDWTEAEERRRVFWNVFNLDRFCSVAMGWNTSLTSDDVNRRLPCDGITWRKEDPVDTPYFGIWDKAAGRIGNPIAFLPSHYAAPSVQKDDEHGHTPSDSGTSPGAQPGTIDMSAVGAFAYSVEATESLSRVNSYFLQQKVNMRDNRDLSSWLTRFKELDLRLVHWKMFLPQKWKASMARQSSRMDPNLTLAHVTHNASMILLHQVMAFPSPEWSFKNRLPSLLSVDTCQAAAVEIANITQNYLKNAPPTVPVASQFAFCIYVAAKVLLLHWRYTAMQTLTPDFWSLLRSLDEMARRWTGLHGLDRGRVNLAAKYSQKLTQFHNRCVSDESYRISVLGYTTEINHTSSRPETRESATAAAALAMAAASQRPALPSRHQPGNGGSSTPTPTGFRPAQLPPPQPGLAMGFAPGPAAGALQGASPIGTGLPGIPRPGAYQHRGGSSGSGELGAISQVFMDQQFMDMDRVISYDDGVFGTGTEYEGGW